MGGCQVSPLVIGIVMGIFYANTLHNHIPNEWQGEIAFSAKKILRFAIVFYGFRITFQEIINVGIEELREDLNKFLI